MRADPPVALLLAASRRGRRASTTTSAPATAALWKPKLRWHQADLGVEGLEAAVGESEADGGEDAVALGASIRAALPGSGSRGHDAPVRSCLYRSSDTPGRAADCAAAAPGPRMLAVKRAP